TAVREERVPVAVDLGLVVAIDRQRDRLGERELRAAVEPDERASAEGEVDRDDRALRAARGLARRGIDAVDPAVGEDRGVEPCGLLGVAVEPEACADLVHDWILLPM